MTANSDFALLILRLVIGGLLAGHGAQKLLGWFGGAGFGGATESMAAIGFRPAAGWAFMAGMAELTGGLLLLLGFLSPLGSVAIVADMVMAMVTVHWGKPIWATQGGGELPLTNIAVAVALAFAGPGGYSLDRAWGLAVPLWLSELAIAIAVVTLLVGLVSRASFEAAPARARG